MATNDIYQLKLDGSGIWTENIVQPVLSNIVEDTTPQLGGALDLNGYPIVGIFTAGESLSAGDVCYLKSDGKFWKAKADSSTTTVGMIAMANAAISANATGQFIIKGKYTTSGLTAGATYFISAATAGVITSTQPATTGNQVRVVGYAISTTVLYFEASQIYIEIA